MGQQEFQAVVLAAGKGTRLPEILEGRPKCLLPIGPYPMIWYPLQLLQRHGFNEVLVIVQESEKSEIQQRMDRLQLKLKLDYYCIPTDSECGTADSLRLVSDKLKADVVVLSCDTVVEANLYHLLSKFRERDASIQLLFVEGGQDQDVTIPGPKSKYKAEKDLIGYDQATSKVLFMASASDFEETVKLPGHLLRENPEMTISSSLLDAHIYIMKKWVVEYLTVSDSLSAVKGELLPHIIKKQMLQPPAIPEGEGVSEFNVNGKTDEIFKFAVHTELDTKIHKASNYNKQKLSHPIRCYAHFADANTFGLRVNNVRSFLSCNLKIFERFPALTGLTERELVSQTSSIKSTQISKCAVGDMTTISEKTSLNTNVVANGCSIQPKTRINNSVLMDGVTVEESVIIDNCIIGEKAVVKSGSVLKNCLVGPHFIVGANTKKENVYLSNADGFMTID
ncbi:translation initiation factor eIF-2B subunit gamma [Anopheles ziemanni]|uniref:translation initiation factor eIF-2B subunit gamma n=1 Tax=Anopheles ziemanni TaxID=345580 RepID=UPI002657C532|nr:translation initiation factor eIF-2B subunit gamma isoform X2 [Anopheles coustani]XP_058167780.1 translation initiation factor eIF-2B subunit gamma [Anopheles ziemanni]